jgi:hypothetical protein
MKATTQNPTPKDMLKDTYFGMSIHFKCGEIFTNSRDGSWTSNLREGKFKQVFVPINFGHARIVIPGEL